MSIPTPSEAGAEIGTVEGGEEDFGSLRPRPEEYSDVDGAVLNLILNDGLPLLPVQWDIYNDWTPLIGCFGSWRSGKTRGGALKTLQVATENPWTPLFRDSHPTSLVMTESHRVIRDSAYREMKALLPTELILKEWTSSNRFAIRLVNGHEIVFRPWLGKMEGLSACSVWLDEAHKLDGPDGPEPMWANIKMRASDPRAKRRITTVTGLPEYGWLSEKFDQPNSQDRATYLCSLRDNFYLTEDVIASLYASTTKEEAQVVVEGKWRKPPTVVFYAFTNLEAPRGNLVSFRGRPSLPVDISIDLGDKGAILVLQRIRVACRGPNGEPYVSNGLVVVDELLPEQVSVKAALRNLFRVTPWKLTASSKVYVDPKADRDELEAIREEVKAGTQGGPRIIKRKAEEDAYYTEYGIRAVNSAFCDLTGNRRLFVCAHLPRGARSIIPALLSQKRSAKTGRVVRDNVTDHVLDCLRYPVADQLPLYSMTTRVQNRAA